MSVSESSPIERRFLTVLFVAALLFHAWGATAAWTSLNLPGCEFRQTQTAISAFFIQRENNFSLAYPTPVLGKPWSIPMEFPLYQWTVVKVSNWLGYPLTQSGRLISLVCFYAGLPALFGLLARLGLSRDRRWMMLGLVLCCPLYIFYARAFLIETMAWMFGMWFLLGYVHAVERCRVSWTLVAAAAGVGCGLVKVTTFLFFLMPAFAWTLWWFWGLRRDGRGWWKSCVWCAAVVALPFAASVWWVGYSDHVKSLSPAGHFLESASMHNYNFGVGMRFDREIWRMHWLVLVREFAFAPVLATVAVLALVFGRRWWAMIALLLFLFVGVQVVFPILYAWHEYYYVANGFVLMLAFGFVVCGVLDSRLPRWAALGVTAGLFGAQGAAYLVHHPVPRIWVRGGSPLTEALKAATEPDDVIVCAGEDWSSLVPYFAQRRALMIRRQLETTWATIDPAFEALKGENVTALILFREQRANEGLLRRALERFDLDPRPAFRWKEAEVYLHRQIRSAAMARLRQQSFDEIEVADAAENRGELRGREVRVCDMLPRLREVFAGFSPEPSRFFSQFGAGVDVYDGRKWISAHPDTRLWFDVGPGKKRVVFDVSLRPEAYGASVPADQRSDGVAIEIACASGGAPFEVVWRRDVNPRDRIEDRGILHVEADVELARAGEVRVAITPGPHGNFARDWAVLSPVRIE